MALQIYNCQELSPEKSKMEAHKILFLSFYFLSLVSSREGFPKSYKFQIYYNHAKPTPKTLKTEKIVALTVKSHSNPKELVISKA